MKKKSKNTARSKRIDALEVIEAVPSKRSTFKTLGGRAKFVVERTPNGIVITNTSESHQELTPAHLQSVCQRYSSLLKSGRHHMASEYVDPKWPERPSRIFSPYVASIVRWHVTGTGKCS